MKGHIKLGAVGSTLRGYKLVNERSYRRVTANPYSAKISTGGGTYDDLEPFAYFLQTDWQSGIGHRNPEEGLLFSTAETRVPNQIILPQKVKQSDTKQDAGFYADCRNIDILQAVDVLKIGPSSPYTQLAIKLDPSGSTNSRTSIGVYGYFDSQGTIGCMMVAGSLAGAPYWSGAIFTDSTYDNTPRFSWLTTPTEANSVHSTPAYLVIRPIGGTLYLPVTAPVSGMEVYGLNSGSATYDLLSGNVTPIFTTNIFALTASTLPLTPTLSFARFNNNLYAGMGTQLVKYNSSTDTWAAVGAARTSAIVGLCAFGTTLHIALASGVYSTMSTAEVYTATGVTRQALYKANGYLWGSSAHNIHYSADGVAWSAAIPCGDVSSPVTGFASLGDAIYAATTEGLYYIAPGDVAVGVTRWGSIRSTNGKSLIEHQGALYCIVDGGIAQVTVSGGSASILPIWINRDEDIVANYLERPIHLVSTNNWLVATVQKGSGSYKSSFWAWTGQGWHYIGDAPMDAADVTYYDFATSRLWFGSQAGVFGSIHVPDYVINPANDKSSSFAPSGWVETGWISGGLKDVDKDWESVYINGDTLSSDQYVEVFYKSARDGDWTYLGKIDDYGEELRWSNYTTRPATKEIKLGFRLFSTSLTKTPDIDVIRVKFLPNVNDRWQWTLPIEVGPGQEMIDGTLNTYTVAQMRSHLEALVQSTPPFLLEDIDGTQYEVVCTGASVDVARLDHYNNEIVPWYIYTMTLEQVRGAAYA